MTRPRPPFPCRPALASGALLAAACLGRPVDPPPRAPAATPRAESACQGALAVEVVERANAERARRGVRALELDARLQEAAQRHASDMARGDFMAHEGSDGSEPGARATRAGYAWTIVSENVAAGQPDAPAVVAGWMASTGHRANLLDPTVRHVGVGHAYRTDTRMRHYWVMVFGATAGVRATLPECD